MNPKCRDPPTAMVDDDGNLISSAKVLEDLALKTYSRRLENRKIKAGLENFQKDKELLCKLRLCLISQNKTQDWTKEQLEKVLKLSKEK